MAASIASTTCTLTVTSQDSTKEDLSALTDKHQGILNLYDQFMQNVTKAQISADESNQLQKAIVFSAEKHQGGVRKNAEKTPYIVHPLGVANIILEEGQYTDVATLIAALLHDTVEDTGTKYSEIYEKFGKEIADIVMEVTDEMDETTGEKRYDRVRRKQMAVDHAPHLSDKAKLVKLADKIYNVRDLPDTWEVEKRLEYAIFSEKILIGIILTQEYVSQIELNSIKNLELVLESTVQEARKKLSPPVSLPLGIDYV